MSRLALLLELRRDGALGPTTRAELDALLADPAQADAALASERTALQVAALLAPRPGLAAAVRAGSERRSRGLRVVRGVRRRLAWRRWAWPAAAALLVAGAALAVLALSPSAAPALALRRGAAEVVQDGRWRPLAPGAAWDGGALRVADEAVFTAADGSEIAFSGASTARWSGDGGLLMELERGAVALRVPPQPGGRRVAVRTPDAEVSVVGTRFRVAADAAGTAVRVEEGRVRVRDRGGERLLAAGESWTTAPADAPPAAGEAVLRGITAPGDGWLADGAPVLRGEDGAPLAVRTTTDPDGAARLVGAGWEVRLQWRPEPGRVTGTLTVRADAGARPMRVQLCELAGAPADGGAWPTAEGWTRDGLPWLWLSGAPGELGVVAEAERADIGLVCAPVAGRQRIELRCPPPADGTATVALFLAAGPRGREPALIAERHAAFAQRHPLAQRWEGLDRLAMFGYAGGAEPTPENPNRWFAGRFDARTPAGRARFRELLLADADAAIAGLRPLGVDGVIVWGLEGTRWINDVGFIADPRRLPGLAPEMDAAADALFARFAAAGLRTGVLVRPWRLELADGRARFVYDGAAAEAELADRIAYARRRWGCTLFVVMFASNDRHDSAGISPDALRRISAAQPGITLVTDLGALAWRGPAGGWQTLSSRRDDPDRAWWKRAYPAGRDLVQVDCGLDDPGLDGALRAALADGGVPMWWWSRDLDAAAWRWRLDRAAPRLPAGK